MFLPVILQKDFGSGAWLFFIILNVVGATAFVFFIRNRNESLNFIDKHKAACYAFSLVTIFFQLFFIGWVLSYSSIIQIALLLASMILLYLMIRYTGFNKAAIALWILSFSIFIIYIWFKPSDLLITKINNQITNININAFYAIPLLALGFLLCPYLDLTFHHVVQADKDNNYYGNRAGFLVGFPLLFAMLMVFSLAYSDSARQLFLNPTEVIEDNIITVKLLFLYFILQGFFTVLAHWQQINQRMEIQNKTIIFLLMLSAITIPFLLNASINEVVYRLFMSFYGILAPAYVWMIVTQKNNCSVKIVLLSVLAALLLSAVPMFSLLGEYNYLYCYAVAIVLAAPFVSSAK